MKVPQLFVYSEIPTEFLSKQKTQSVYLCYNERKRACEGEAFAQRAAKCDHKLCLWYNKQIYAWESEALIQRAAKGELL